MNILFVRDFPSIDGSFTLLLRLGRRFKQDGHGVFYIDFGKKSTFDEEIAETFSLIKLEYLVSGKNLPSIDVLFPFADGDLLYWTITELKNRHFKNAKIIIGVYHPRAYMISTHLGPSPDTRIYKKLLSKIPSQNILFMNELVKIAHEKYLGIQFTNSPVIPLPVNLTQGIRNFSNINRKKIVSIGRLENFKKYVFAMLQVIEQLNNSGENYQYYIYGHGQLEESIINYIRLKNIGDYIFFMGKLEYKKIYSVLEDAFMFIGMGTVIIESSSIGVPCLQAIESEREQVSYGFFSDLEGLGVGEENEALLKVCMRQSIKELSQKNEQEYIEFSLAHVKRANTFDINKVIIQYYAFIKKASAEFRFEISTTTLYFIKFIRQFYKIKWITQEKHRDK